MKTAMITFYTKENCPLCDKAKLIIEELANEFSITIEEKDIYKDDQLLELYQVMIPVISLNGEELAYGLIDYQDVRNQLIEKMG
ncbi:glutaredoxin [Bacillus mesophilus]|uniref:Glutaredoxin family protein n=1 Tax=Bacillus mesophilus TaxID=1808955 RepID=A0A6M0QAY3_9BACI|nr:glutaredoxin family protein [Bacillus mesophilus]MBM7661518.1 glutaredoxin [Bacillus mesophilus]NEY72188.1 glutaredoxin family protein [Bacillus mesophilus]